LSCAPASCLPAPCLVSAQPPGWPSSNTVQVPAAEHPKQVQPKVLRTCFLSDSSLSRISAASSPGGFWYINWMDALQQRATRHQPSSSCCTQPATQPEATPVPQATLRSSATMEDESGTRRDSTARHTCPTRPRANAATRCFHSPRMTAHPFRSRASPVTCTELHLQPPLIISAAAPHLCLCRLASFGLGKFCG
jgi:hypothetical protein